MLEDIISRSWVTGAIIESVTGIVFRRMSSIKREEMPTHATTHIRNVCAKGREGYACEGRTTLEPCDRELSENPILFWGEFDGAGEILFWINRGE